MKLSQLRCASRRLTAAPVVALATIVLAAVTAVPAGARTVPAPRFGAAFCGAVSTWYQDLSARTDAFSSPSTFAGLGPAQSKAVIIDFLANAIDGTEELATTLRRAGTPAVPNGARMGRELRRGVEGLEERLAAAAAAARALPTDDPVAFVDAVDALEAQLTDIDAPFNEALAAVTRLDTKYRLDAALRKVPACRSLAGR